MSSLFTKSTGEQAEFKTTYKAPDPEQKKYIPDNTKIKAQIISAVWKDVTDFNDKPQPVIEYMVIEKGDFEGIVIKQQIHLGALTGKGGEPNFKKRDKAIDFFASLLAIGGKGLIQKFEKAGKPVEMNNELLSKELFDLKLIINARLMEQPMVDFKTGEPMIDSATGKQRISYTQYIDGCQKIPAFIDPETVEEDDEFFDKTEEEPEEELDDSDLPF
jgi:hypothetical protein